MSKEKIKVYLYTRVSTSIQIEGYSLEAQKSRMFLCLSYQDLQEMPLMFFLHFR